MGRSTVTNYDDESGLAQTRGDQVKSTGKGGNGKTPGHGQSKDNWKPRENANQQKDAANGGQQCGLVVDETRRSIAMENIIAR